MEKYGFVYIWYDRKHKRFYIGCHWGRENDSYVCSSNWMRNSYNRRKEDFKRRILSRIYTNRKELLEEEYKWLQLIKDEELRIRYYNLSKKHFGHWSSNENGRKSISEKMKGNTNGRGNIGRKATPEEIEKNRQQANKYWSELKAREEQSKLKKEYYAIHVSHRKGLKHSQEEIERNRKCLLDLWQNPEWREKQLKTRNSPEVKLKKSIAIKAALKKKKENIFN